MQKNTSFWLGIGCLIALVLLGGIFFYSHRAQAPTTTSTATTTTKSLGNGITVTGSGDLSGVSVTTTNPAPTITAPSLKRQTSFSANLSADQVAQLRSSEQAMIAILTKDPGQASAWLQLALDYKTAGDYSGAIAIWEYLARVSPKNYIPFNNLGDMYMNYAVDYPKAVTNYLKVVSLLPTNIDAYHNLYIIYRYHLNNPSAAASIVAQGLKANPGNPDLLALQSQS